jgi:hypothetical protein
MKLEITDPSLAVHPSDVLTSFIYCNYKLDVALGKKTLGPKRAKNQEIEAVELPVSKVHKMVHPLVYGELLSNVLVRHHTMSMDVLLFCR